MDELIVELERSFVPVMARTMKFVDYFISDKMKDHGYKLSKEQWVMLKVLYQHGGQPQNNLAFLTNRDKGSLARLLNTMESKNLVARIPSKTDKRINEIYLTKHGELILKDSVPIFKEIINEIENEINEEEKRIFISVLNKIRKNIQTEEIVAVETKKL